MHRIALPVLEDLLRRVFPDDWEDRLLFEIEKRRGFLPRAIRTTDRVGC